MFKNRLVVGLILVLTLVMGLRFYGSLRFPLLSRAQVSNTPQIPGPHVAFFDEGNNKAVPQALSAVSKEKLNITVMVEITASSQTVKDIFAAASADFNPMIRVTGLNLTERELAEIDPTLLRDALNGAGLPEGTLVIFGNEVNNLSVEFLKCDSKCPERLGEAGRKYADLFEDFSSGASGWKLIPAPLDQYNGDYSWEIFKDAAISAYAGRDLVANVYELDAIPGTTDDLQVYTKLPGRVIAFTEFGPDPKRSLSEHLDFYKSTLPDKPATTLVPNKCTEEEGDWLYFVEDAIYDKNGAKVDPENCETSNRRGRPPEGDYYKRFIYPFYDSNYSAEQIFSNLKKSYSVTCSGVKKYDTKFVGDLAELIREESTKCEQALGGNNITACLFNPEMSLKISTDRSIFGTLRDEVSVKWRAYDEDKAADNSKRSFTSRWESIEQWLGANNPAEYPRASREEDVSEGMNYLNTTPDDITPLHQGPFYKLTTPYMQCRAAVEVIRGSSRVCSEWSQLSDNAGKPCPLLEKPVRGSSYTVGSLLSEVEANGSEELCEAAFNYTRDAKPSDAIKRLANTTRLVDLYQETAYRPAFLVVSMKVSPDDGAFTSATSTGRTITYSRQGEVGENLVDFLVYHVPDTLTDENPSDPGIGRDITTRPVDTFTQLENETPVVDVAGYQKSFDESRQKITSQNYDLKTPIDCRGGKCEEPLRRALIDFINSYASGFPQAKCEVEPAPDIAEKGVKLGSDLEPADSGESWTQNSKAGEPIDRTESLVVVNEYIRQDGQVLDKGELSEPSITVFNVSPHGIKSKYVADAFDALFTLNSANEQFSDAQYKEFFEALFLTNAQSSPDEVEYEKYLGQEYDPISGQFIRRTETRKASDEVVVPEDQARALFPWVGKVFNYSSRAVVQQVSSAGQYLLECARAAPSAATNTEDFLTRCRGFGVSVVDSDNSSNRPIRLSGEVCKQIDEASEEVIDAIERGASRHGCDPHLMYAIAKTESGFDPEAENPGSGATGLFQFMETERINSWTTWWNPGVHQPASFTQVDPNGKFNCNSSNSPLCSRKNPYANADAGCRHVKWLGFDKYYDDRNNFVRAFSQCGDNLFAGNRQIWNGDQNQANQVYDLWHSVKQVCFGDGSVGLSPTATPTPTPRSNNLSSPTPRLLATPVNTPAIDGVPTLPPLQPPGN